MDRLFKNKQILLIFLAWALYTSAYIGRYSYTANMEVMKNFYNITSDAQVGAIGSFFFFSYGIGQVVNGFLCKYYNAKYVLSIAVIVSAIVNFILFLCIVPFQYIQYLWLVNGIAQSFLWTSLLLTLSKNLDAKYIKISIVAMATTVSIGTLLAYGFAAIIGDNFKYSFLFAFVVLIIAGVLWFLFLDKCTNKSANYAVSNNKENLEKTTERKKMDKSVVKVLILFGVVAIMVNFIKDGLMAWVPSVLINSFNLDASISKVLTIVLPICAIFGTTFIVALNKKVKDFSMLAAITFLMACIFLGIVLLLFNTTLWLIILIALGFTSMMMSAANNLVTSIIPLSLRDKANSGFLGGILDGFCYLGSALSTVGMGALKDYFLEWTPVFNVLLILSVLVVVICFVSAVVNKIKNRKSLSEKIEG